MKTLIYASALGFLALFVTSCASVATFPVSSMVPAAEITAKKTQDKNKNYIIELTAKNLASPERLSPAKNNYSVWILTANNETKNIGQLNNSNGKTTKLKTLTVFDVNEIFITVEDQGNLSYPMGTEISRTVFNRSKIKAMMNN